MSKRRITTHKVKKTYPIEAEDIFKKWSLSNKKIFGDIISSEGEKKITIKVLNDTYCVGKYLTETKLISKEQLCPGCEMLARFLVDPVVGEDGLIEIQVKAFKGCQLKRSYSKCQHFEYNLNESLNELSGHILSRIEKMTPQKMLNPSYHYSSKTGGLNYVIISIIMDKISQLKNFPHSTNLMWCYACDGHVVTIDKVSRLGMNSVTEYFKSIEGCGGSSPKAQKRKVNKIPESTIRDLICQLTCILYFFSKFQLSHGCPTLDHLSISEKVVDYSYMGKKVYSSFALTLLPSEWSSITYSKSRFYYSGNRNIIHDIPVTLGYFISEIPTSVECHIDYCEEYYNSRAVCFKAQDGYLEMIREEGIPLFASSWDFSCFMLSLLCQPKFYDSFVASDIERIWRACWKYDEYSKLMLDIEALHSKEVTSSDLFGVLKKYNIRTDILDVFMEEI